ncbi:MAG: hypothetical protein KF823_16430 [Xanthomonadales bacterium]|nr:hypothetical protein [Xanthomonadales bacterium]
MNGKSAIRRLRRVLWVLAVAWLAWLLVGNLALNTGLAERLVNRKPEAFTMQWRHGLTLWPGQAWLWRVQVGGHQRRIVWRGHAARVGGRIALLPLLARTLQIPMLQAHQVDFEFDQVEHDRLPAASRPGGWILRFPLIATDSLAMLRAGPLFLDGVGQVRFGISKQLRGGPLEILPSSGSLHGARLRQHDQVLLDGAEIMADFALPAHRRERAPGLSRLGLADARLRLSGRTPGLAVHLDEAGRWRSRLESLDAQRPGGPAPGELQLDLTLDGGALAPGGSLALRLPLAADLRSDQQTWRAEGRMALSVLPEAVRLELHLPPPPGDGGRLDATLDLAGRHLPFACVAAPADQPGLGPSCSIDRDPAHQLARIDGGVDLHWHFERLHWLQPLLGNLPWLALEGAGRVEAALRIASGALAPGSQLLVPALDARIAVLDNRFSGQAHARVDIEPGPNGPQALAALVVDRFELRPADAAEQAYVLGRDLRLDLTLPADLARAGHDIQARLRFDDALVPDLRVYNRYLPPGGIVLDGGRGVLSGDLRLDAEGEVGSGRIVLRGQQVRMTLGQVHLQGELAVDTRLRRLDLARRQFDLAGTTVRLDQVEGHEDGRRARARPWSADFRLRTGQVGWQRPLKIDSTLSAQASDVALLLGLFGPLRQFPDWTLRLVDSGPARLDGRVRLDGRALELAPLHARNDRFDVHARLRLGQGGPSGALLMAWGRLKAALELADGDRRWHLRGAETWFHGGGTP